MYSSTILDLGTRWRWGVSFTSLPLYPRGKSPRYPLDRRLGGPQTRSERYGEEKNVASARPCSPSLYRLSYLGLHIWLNRLEGKFGADVQRFGDRVCLCLQLMCLALWFLFKEAFSVSRPCQCGFGLWRFRHSPRGVGDGGHRAILWNIRYYVRSDRADRREGFIVATKAPNHMICIMSYCLVR
jgi:hypothetical protein